VPASAPAVFFVPARRRVPAPCPAGICVLFPQFLLRTARDPGRQHPGQAVSWPRHAVPAAPCSLGRARPALAPGRSVCLVQAGISAASPRPASLRPALAGMEAPDILDLSVPGVVAYPGQPALPVMLLSCSRCAQQCQLLRESAPGRHSFQLAAVPLSDAIEK
jgi:hypothetical protein